jgi:hypothetical protein
MFQKSRERLTQTISVYEAGGALIIDISHIEEYNETRDGQVRGFSQSSQVKSSHVRSVKYSSQVRLDLIKAKNDLICLSLNETFYTLHHVIKISEAK